MASKKDTDRYFLVEQDDVNSLGAPAGMSESGVKDVLEKLLFDDPHLSVDDYIIIKGRSIIINDRREITLGGPIYTR